MTDRKHQTTIVMRIQHLNSKNFIDHRCKPWKILLISTQTMKALTIEVKTRKKTNYTDRECTKVWLSRK